MNQENLITELARFRDVVVALVDNVKEERAKWKPVDGNWSILEILTHLADEEVEDFGTRVRMTLEDPSAKWPPIDPEGWAVKRQYNQGNVRQVLDRFCAARDKSVQWLRSLEDPDWSRAYQHRKFGPIHAGDLLAAWAAHDAFHLRQMAKRMFQLAEVDAGEYKTRYAGTWSS